MNARPDPPLSSAPARYERLLVVAILAIYLVVGALYATRTPPYNAPDEPAHFNYVRDLAERATFPVLRLGDWDAARLDRLKSSRFPPGSDVSTIRYESHQPPLYYLAVAPVARLAVGLGERGELVAVRLATLVVGALALLALYRVAALLFVGDSVARLTTLAFAAFVPMHVGVAASVSNDLAAELFLSLVLWQSLLILRGGIDRRRAAFLGLAVGLGLLTKLSDYVALPIAAVAILAAAATRPARIRALLLSGGIAALIVAPWLLRGVLVYGVDDPFGLRRHDQVVAGQQLTGEWTRHLVASSATTLLHSFWGQFGWMGVLLDERIYAVLGALTAFGGLGVMLWLAPWGGFWRELDAPERRTFGLAGLLVLGITLGTLGYNLTYLQPQGRYLFPAMAGIAVWTVAGWRELIAARQRAALSSALCVGLVALDLIALVRYVEPALRP